MKYYKYIIIILSILVLGLVGYVIYLHSTSSLLENTNNQNNDIIQVKDEELDYDCSFTRTYRVVDLLDGYIAEVPEMSYIVLDAYQSHAAFTHKVSTELKNKLEVDKYYEFTYTLKGTGVINDIEDVLKYNSFNNLIKSDNSLRVLLEIKETDKLGMEQIQEPICEGK